MFSLPLFIEESVKCELSYLTPLAVHSMLNCRNLAHHCKTLTHSADNRQFEQSCRPADGSFRSRRESTYRELTLSSCVSHMRKLE